MLLLAKLGEWILRRVVWLALFGGIAIAGFAFYLYLQENLYSESWRQNRLIEISLRKEHITYLAEQASEQLVSLQKEVDTLSANLRRQQQEIARRKEQLEALVKLWNRVERLWSQEANEEYRREQLKLEEMERHNHRQLRLFEVRNRETTTLREDIDQLQNELQNLNYEQVQLEASRSKVVHYLKLSYQRILPTILAAALLIWITPFLWKVFRYYLVAPLLLLGKPVRLRKEPCPPPRLSPRNVSQVVYLAPGEHAMVKPEFLQASDESLRRRTRWLLDWRIPFTSMACRLSMLVELRNRTEDFGGMLTVSSQDEIDIELTTLELAETGRLILRPRYLAAVAKPQNHRMRIRRHWRLFHIHSWLTLQFRYFEIEGPCRLILWGSRGIRMETLVSAYSPTPARSVAQTISAEPTSESRLINSDPQGTISEPARMPFRNARRTNKHATIGFTPDLAYHSVRAETFWAYARGQNPLFDDLFIGDGVFLCQEVSAQAEKGMLRRWSESFWDGFLKLFGW